MRTFALIATTATEADARALARLIAHEISPPEDCLKITPSEEHLATNPHVPPGPPAVWIDTPKTISKDRVRRALDLGRGFVAGYVKAVANHTRRTESSGV